MTPTQAARRPRLRGRDGAGDVRAVVVRGRVAPRAPAALAAQLPGQLVRKACGRQNYRISIRRSAGGAPSAPAAPQSCKVWAGGAAACLHKRQQDAHALRSGRGAPGVPLSVSAAEAGGPSAKPAGAPAGQGRLTAGRARHCVEHDLRTGRGTCPKMHRGRPGQRRSHAGRRLWPRPQGGPGARPARPARQRPRAPAAPGARRPLRPPPAPAPRCGAPRPAGRSAPRAR